MVAAFHSSAPSLALPLKQVEPLIDDRVREVHVGMSNRGHNYMGNASIHVDKRQRGKTPKALWKRMKHRAAVEPSIGHLKNEHRLKRNRLSGGDGRQAGDSRRVSRSECGDRSVEAAVGVSCLGN